MEEKSFDLAISLDSLSLIDTYFHINKPTVENLQSNVAASIPQHQLEVTREDSRMHLHALVSVQFMLFNGMVPSEIRQEDLDNAVLSFGTAVEVSVGSPILGDAIPAGKHAAITEDDLTTERDKRMERNMMLEALKAAYSFASTRLLEMSALSPLGSIPMPLVDADELLRDIESRG